MQICNFWQSSRKIFFCAAVILQAEIYYITYNIIINVFMPNIFQSKVVSAKVALTNMKSLCIQHSNNSTIKFTFYIDAKTQTNLLDENSNIT